MASPPQATRSSSITGSTTYQHGVNQPIVYKSRISYGRKASNEEISRLKRRINKLEGSDNPLQASEPRETGKKEDHHVHPDLSGGKETLYDA